MMSNTLLTATVILLLYANAARCQDTDSGSAPGTGELRLTFTFTEVAGADAARAVESIISPDEPITWEVYVPDGYQAEDPAGLMIYISPSMSGQIPRRWQSVMDKYNIIWIAANRSGNRVTVARRATFALVAPTLAAIHYNIDRERIYLSGFSGGGKMTGMLAADYPHVFKGAIYICGINSLDKHPSKQFELFKQNHYVFVTGTWDHALDQTKRVHRQYLSSGVDNSKLMIIRNMTHANPSGSIFGEAIQYLDSRITPDDTFGQHDR
jgi:dienelactone hydrolase